MGITVQIMAGKNGPIKLAGPSPNKSQQGSDHIEFAPPPVAVDPGFSAPLPGARPESVRVLRQEQADDHLIITLEGRAGSSFRIPVFQFLHLPKLAVDGAELQDGERVGSLLVGRFPEGEGWKTITVTLTW